MRVHLNSTQRRVRVNQALIKKDTLTVLTLLGFDAKRTEIDLSIVGERRMRTLNQEYRGVASTTDVLSFPLHEFSSNPPFEPPHEEGPFLLGEIVIDPARAQRQAREAGVSLHEELRRLMIHGVLHLLGYDHEGSDYAARKMRKRERELLELLD